MSSDGPSLNQGILPNSERSIVDAGVFILSVDVELAWGIHDVPGFARFKGELEHARSTIARMLALCEKYNVEATWIVVGHLLLDHCARVNGIAHPDVSVPSYPWFPGHWHKNDPCTNIHEDPTWYGTDIVRQVLACPVSQEIGCHTFSHIMVGDPACSAGILESQIEACLGLAREWGITLESFAFPRDAVAHVGILRDKGFKVYRGMERRWYRRLPRPARSLAHFLDRLLAVTPPTYNIGRCCEEGIVNAPASMLLMRTQGMRRMIPAFQRVRQAKLGLARAVKRAELFHLRLHPWEMAGSSLMLQCLEEIFKTAADYRDAGRLLITNMSRFADYAGEREPRLVAI